MSLESTHWYRRGTGAECHKIIGRNGKTRSPSLRDAKKGLVCYKCNGDGFAPPMTPCDACADSPGWTIEPYGIVPSVTTITKSLGTPPGLVRWLKQQCVLTALTLPRQDGESLDDFAERVLREDADRWSKDAMDLGTRVHDAIEASLKFETLVVEPVVREIWEAWEHWADKALDLKVPPVLELPFATDTYGGKIDFIGRLKDGRLAILDWKTCTTKGGKVTPYPEHGEQLAAYKRGALSRGFAPDVIANVYLSTNEPGVVHYHEWDINACTRRWWHKHDYYCESNNWHPEKQEAA